MNNEYSKTGHHTVHTLCQRNDELLWGWPTVYTSEEQVRSTVRLNASGIIISTHSPESLGFPGANAQPKIWVHLKISQFFMASFFEYQRAVNASQPTNSTPKWPSKPLFPC